MTAVDGFEGDKGRAIGHKDIIEILKSAKIEDAKRKGISSLSIVSPTKMSEDKYLSLLSQLDEERSKTGNVQRKSEARFIAERSFRNAISYIFTVAVTHYKVGAPDPRLKSIDKATGGAKRLYKLIQKENEGKDLKVVLPFLYLLLMIQLCLRLKVQ